MKSNIRPAERLFRFLAGAAILSLVFRGPETPWGYLGLIAILSAASGFCPLYKAVGRGCDACDSRPPKA